MNLNEHAAQAYADSARWFPHTADDIPFAILALTGEVGEAANLVKKVVRETYSWEAVLHVLIPEVVDIQTYLFKLMGQISALARACADEPTDLIDWDEQYDFKRAFNEERFGQMDNPMYTRAELDAKTAEAM